MKIDEMLLALEKELDKSKKEEKATDEDIFQFIAPYKEMYLLIEIVKRYKKIKELYDNCSFVTDKSVDNFIGDIAEILDDDN